MLTDRQTNTNENITSFAKDVIIIIIIIIIIVIVIMMMMIMIVVVVVVVVVIVVVVANFINKRFQWEWNISMMLNIFFMIPCSSILQWKF